MSNANRLVLDRFRVVGTLAKGGMGEVLLADDARTGRRVVLKLLRRDVDDGDAEIRFEHEITVARRLHHPLIPYFIDDGKWGARRVLAIEYVDGVSLSAIMRQRGTALPAMSALFIAVDVLRALNAAHCALTDDGVAADIKHGDVSPQNIVIGRDGRARLIDFGISTERAFPSRCGPGQVAGKIAYLAPEQLLCRDVDARADQYSAGVVLVEMLIGRALFSGDAIDSDSPTAGRGVPAFLVLLPALPPALRGVLARLLSLDRACRYSTCRDAFNALLAAAVDLPEPTETPCDLATAALTAGGVVDDEDEVTVADRRIAALAPRRERAHS